MFLKFWQSSFKIMNITTLIMVYFINLYFFFYGLGGVGVRELQQNIEIQFTAKNLKYFIRHTYKQM